MNKSIFHLWRLCSGCTAIFILALGLSGNALADFRITSASWSDYRDQLTVQGDCDYRRSVTVTNAGDSATPVGSDECYRGHWSVRKSYSSSSDVPCRVRAVQSDGKSDERNVSNIDPSRCDDGGGTTPPGDGGFPKQTDFKIMMNYELGMHCTGFEFAYCCVLPVYNSILAQVVKPQSGEDGFARLLEGDPNIGRELDVLGRETVLRDLELDGKGDFKKYVLRYWHDAQPRNDGTQTQGTLISNVEGHSLLAWNTIADAAWVGDPEDPDYGKLRLSGRDGNPLYNGARDVVLGNCAFGEANCYDDVGHFPAPDTPIDNYQNAVWNHLYIYSDTEGSAGMPGGDRPESDKLRLGLHVAYPTNVGPAGHIMGPNNETPLENVLTFSGETGTVVFTQMKVLEDLPITLTSPRIWEALGLPLTPFEDSINFFGEPGAIDEDSVRPYVAMKAQLFDYHTGNAVMDRNDNPVIGFGTAPIDIPNCERCHSELTGYNSAQRPDGAANGARNPEVAALVNQEMAFWMAYYPSLAPAAGGHDWYARLKGAAISILAIHDNEHGTGFTDLYPGVEATGPGSTTPPLSYCTNPGVTPGTLCTDDANCNTGALVCDAGNPATDGTSCSEDSDCAGGLCNVPVADGVCTGSAGTRLWAGDDVTPRDPRLDLPQNTRLGHDSVICQKCHADNVIAVVKSASCGPGNIGCSDGDLIPPLTEAIHHNHRSESEGGLIAFNDKHGRDGGCQGCHPAHRSDGDMSKYPINDDGSNYYAGLDNRDANGGCFVGRDVHSNRMKDVDGAETPSHLNAVGAWLVKNVAEDTGDWKGIWCTNCHSQLGQEIWKAENMVDLINGIPGEGAINVRGGEVDPTGDVEAALETVLTYIGMTDFDLGRSWLDPKGNAGGTDPGVILSADGVDRTHDIWAANPGLCDYVDAALGGNPINPAQDANVAVVKVSLGGAGGCPDTAWDVNGDGAVTDDPLPAGDQIPCATPFHICGSYDTDGDFNVALAGTATADAGLLGGVFCTTPDCMEGTNPGAACLNDYACPQADGTFAVAVPFSAATDGRDHWLAAGEPHCADCHAAPYVEQSGNIDAYPPFNYPRKASLMRYSRGHRDITCQGCHESIHGLYPVTYDIDTTTYAQAASLNADGSHGPLKCATCHEVDRNDGLGLPKRIDDLEYKGQRIKSISDPAARFDAAVGWAHTFTQQADLKNGFCLNCHENEWDEIGYREEEWLEHAMKGRVSRLTMDQAEIEKQGYVSGDPDASEDPRYTRNTVCRGCHEDEWSEVSCSGEDGREWKQHLIEGRVSEKVWEYVTEQRVGRNSDGTLCTW